MFGTPLPQPPSVTATPIMPASTATSVPNTPRGGHLSSSSFGDNSFLSNNNPYNNNNQQQQQQQQHLLVVSAVDGKRYKLVSKHDVRRLTSANIKRFVEIVAGIPQQFQVLRYGGTVLGDGRCVGDFGIHNADVLSLEDLRTYNQQQRQQAMDQQYRNTQQANFASASSSSSTGGLPPMFRAPSPQLLQQQQHQQLTAAELEQLNAQRAAIIEQQKQQMELEKKVRAQMQNLQAQSAELERQQRGLEESIQRQQEREASQRHSIESAASVALQQQSQQQQQQQHASLADLASGAAVSGAGDTSALSAANTIVQLQQRLLQKEQELQAQQDTLSRLVVEQQQRARAQSEESFAGQSREMSQLREEVRRVEQAAQSAAATAAAALETSMGKQQQQLQQQRQPSTPPPSLQGSPTRAKAPPIPPPPGSSRASSVDVSPNRIVQDARAALAAGQQLNNNSSGGGTTNALSNEQQQHLVQFFALPPRERAYRQTVAAVQWLTRRGLVARDAVRRLDSAANDTWTVDVLGTDDGAVPPMTLLFSFDDETRRLYLYSTLLHFLPHDPAHKLALYEALLEGSLMGREMAGGGVGVSVKNNLVLMATSLDAAHSDGEASAAIVGPFVESAQAWAKAAMQILHGSSKTILM